MSRLEAIWTSPLGRMILGIIKIAMAGFILALLSTFSNFVTNPTIGDMEIPVATIIQLIVGFFPILLLFSALSDLGVKL